MSPRPSRQTLPPTLAEQAWRARQACCDIPADLFPGRPGERTLRKLRAAHINSAATCALGGHVSGRPWRARRRRPWKALGVVALVALVPACWLLAGALP